MTKHPAVPYVFPFALFLFFLGLQSIVSIPETLDFPIRLTVLAAALWFLSRKVIDFHVSRPLTTVGIGLLVFLIWIGPDTLFPGYRQHWLFQNAITGSVRTTLSSNALGNPLVLCLRVVRAALFVPIIEELFWRGWLMRWLINPDFQKVPLGSYTAQAFWISAFLFAAEHGPYWEVGLLAGVVYNWWMVRTRSLGDLILAHAVTNGALASYVLVTKHWEFWL